MMSRYETRGSATRGAATRVACVLHADRVTATFGALTVIDGIDLQVRAGEFVALVGPSGCGKTTLLHLCSGWLRPTRGEVHRPAASRMVFQEDGLFPWLTVDENLHLGLRQIADPAERTRRAADLLALIGLTGFAASYPHQLSGGMRQRVELARALAGETPLLLMDEPFSSLDYLTRLKLRQELVRLLAARPRTVLFVTHDLEEASQLADRVLVLSERPARVRDELRLTAPRPRDPASPEVTRAVRYLLSVLDDDQDAYADQAAPPRDDAAADRSVARVGRVAAHHE